MDFFYLGVLIFLFVLATFDLSVGVANDAVNFLSPAVGAKAAKFRTILIVAAVVDIPGGETDGSLQGLIGDVQLVVLLIFLPQALQYLQRRLLPASAVLHGARPDGQKNKT